MKTQEFVIQIEMQWNASRNEAYEKLLAWLEHNGHTSVSNGFEIKELRKLKDNE